MIMLKIAKAILREFFVDFFAQSSFVFCIFARDFSDSFAEISRAFSANFSLIFAQVFSRFRHDIFAKNRHEIPRNFRAKSPPAPPPRSAP